MTRRTRESISTAMQRPCGARRLSLHFLLLPVTVVVAGNAVGGVQCRSDGASVVSVTSGKVGGGGGATSSQPLLHCTLQWAPECESVQTEEGERQPRSHQIPLCSLTRGEIFMLDLVYFCSDALYRSDSLALIS